MLFTAKSNKKKIPITDRSTSEVSFDDDSENEICLTETGIVLVQATDPLSRLIQYITKQEYSVVGIYRKYDSTDDAHIRLVDILRGETPIWLREYRYLSDLKRCKYIPKAVIYSTDIILADDIVSSNLSIKETLIYLFGNNLCLIPPIESLSIVLQTDLYMNINPILSMVENSSIINLNSKYFIINSDIKYKSKRFKKDRPYISNLIATFIDMILSDLDFLDLVVGKYLNKVHPYDILYEIVTNHMENHRDVISFFNELFVNGTTNKERLDTLIQNIRNVSSTHSLNTNVEENIIPDIPTDLIVIDKTPTPEIRSTVNGLHEQLYRIAKSIKSNKIPYIEINSIIDNFNSISDYYGIDKTIDLITEPVSGVIIVSPEGEPPISLSLKTGNDIVLTTRNFDLSIFTRNELIEILEHIDKIVSDNRFDQLRNQITKEIASR